MLPMFLHFKLQRPNRIPINLPIPLIVVYLLLLPFIVLGVLIYLLIPIHHEYLPLIKALPSLLTATVGTEITIVSDDHDIHLTIF